MTDGLSAVITAKLTQEQRQALAEIAAYHKTSESELLRNMVISLVRAFEDLKAQASLGGSVDDLVGRSTRFALTHLINLSPDELRKLADQFKEAAYQLAAMMEDGPLSA